jgi:hypothetical protein
VEVVAAQVDGGELLVGDLDALGIVALVELGVDAQPGVGRRCGDRVDDDLVADYLPRK